LTGLFLVACGQEFATGLDVAESQTAQAVVTTAGSAIFGLDEGQDEVIVRIGEVETKYTNKAEIIECSPTMGRPGEFCVGFSNENNYNKQAGYIIAETAFSPGDDMPVMDLDTDEELPEEYQTAIEELPGMDEVEAGGSAYL
jgi:hypothetical protein